MVELQLGAVTLTAAPSSGSHNIVLTRSAHIEHIANISAVVHFVRSGKEAYPDLAPP